MELPEALHPWRPWLDWFPAELAPEIGRLVQRLSPLLGPLRGNRQAIAPEPDGLDDLRRRGPYERLLNSEWLLADELPDEFLRRAAAGEHLFLSPRPRARQAERVIVALFDAGPLQLGAARLVHIALWILLARRAAEAGGALRWGVLQAPGPLLEAASPPDLRRLLKSRSLVLAEPWSRWQEYLAETALTLGELWHIGAAPPEMDSADGLRPSHVVTVRRGVATDGLEIEIGEGLRRRSALLALPASPLAEQLLKARFLDPAPPRAHAQTARAFAITRPPVLAPGGGAVAVPLLGQRGFDVVRIPQIAGKAAQPKPQQLPKNAAPLTLAFHGKTLGALLSGQDGLRFWQTGLPATPHPPRETFQATVARANWLASAWVKDNRINRFYVLDEAHRLVYWASGAPVYDAAEPRGKCHLVATDVLSLAAAGSAAIVFARQEAGELFVHFDNGYFGHARKYRLVALPGTTAVHFAGGQNWASGVCGCAVLSRKPPETTETWTLYNFRPRYRALDDFVAETLTLPPRHLGIGMVPSSAGSPYALVVLGPTGRDVLLYQRQDFSETLFTSPSKILKVVVDGASGMIAMLTEERQLIAYSAPDKTLRLFLHSKAPADD
jgi:hypothetical protein